MFKQMLENKIGEKLNTFNNSGKQAFEWMGKFRQSFDITEKIQQQFSTTSTGSSKEDESLYPTSVSSESTSSTNFFDTVTRNASIKKPEIREVHSVDESMVSTPPRSPSNVKSPPSLFNSGISPKSSVKTSNAKKLTNNHLSLQVANEDIDDYLKSPSQNSIASSSVNNANSSSPENGSINQPFCHSNSVSVDDPSSRTRTTNGYHDNDDDSADDRKSQSKRSAAYPRTLVRQSTDLTSSFPLKPFQRLNSETVEIPGLNVKVVRYRMTNDLGKIDPHLYKKYNLGGVDANLSLVKGKLFFALRYNEEIQSFSVTVNRAEIFNTLKQQAISASSATANGGGSLLNIAEPSLSGKAPGSPNLNRPDTYVKIQLLPDKKRKYQTRIQRKSVAPVFEETFYFQLPYEELKDKTLYMSLFEFGRFSKHELVGSIRLGDLNLIKDLNAKDVEFTRNLTPLADDDLELGELTLTLCYLPAAGRLTVTIVKAINLKAMDINGKSDPYVKVTTVSRGKRIKKKKTSVMKNTLHPVFNESMLFDIPQDQVDAVDMVVKVIDYDRVGQNELIGCIGIGPSFSGVGRDHWYRMLENPRKPITQSYYLKDSNFLREGLPARVENALRQESLESRTSDH